MSVAAQTALALLPWLLVAVVVVWRARGSRMLQEESGVAPDPPPLVSVIIPARDEARNIGRCVKSVVATAYPRVELIVVDDHSTDQTAALARAAACGDPRLRVIVPPALPDGWFGKSWACWTGAGAASGDFLLFTDADTKHAPDLIPRLVNARAARDAGLISVAGRQEVGSFWEKVIQPMVFTMLLIRYGGTERVASSQRVEDKIANGQCILMPRVVYDAVGGHESVRDKVAEDLMLAQRTFIAGHRVEIVIGPEQLSTRMYTSLGELVRGWGKNIFAGAADAMPFGWVGRVVLLPLVLLVPWIAMLAPLTVLILTVTGVIEQSPVPAAAAALLLAAMFGFVVRGFGLSPTYGLLYPVGAAAMLYIVTGAIVRGRSVGWKGREYRIGP